MHDIAHRGLRVLVIASNRWAFPCQVAVALGQAGFRVAAVCPTRSPVYRLAMLQARFRYRSYSAFSSIRSAISAWSPDILVCSDDAAVRAVHDVYCKALRTPGDPRSSKIVKLIQVSFGSVQNLVDTQSKSRVLSLAEALGVRCPQTRVLANKSALEQIEQDLCFPLIVKADEGWGGLGVRLVNNALELRIAIAELSLPYHWPRRAKRLIARRIWRIFLDWWAKWPNKISVQQYVVGNPCNLAAVCWKGRVLAGITVDVLATSNEFGPATAVRIINHPDVEDAAAKIISTLELSGFLGLDFIHDREGRAWFLEMNARATPTCHIATRGQDLAGALFEQLTGTAPQALRQKISQDIIVLSPKKTVGAGKLFVTLEEVDAPNAARNR